MRNLKKFLALVLAMVMAFSLMLTANAAHIGTQYTDEDDVEPAFEEAVEVLTGMGVYQGDAEAATFRPASTINRAEVAALIYRLATGDVTDARKDLYKDYGGFVDVNSSDWFAGYVGYCANAGYIKGHGGYFNPYDSITGYEVLAMVLRAVGYDKNHEFEGAAWQTNVSARSTELGILKQVKSTHYGDRLYEPSRRDVVASLLFESAQIPMVNYTEIGGYNKFQNLIDNTLNDSLGYKNFGLTTDTGVVLGNEATGEDKETVIGIEGRIDYIDDTGKAMYTTWDNYAYPGYELVAAGDTADNKAIGVPRYTFDFKTGLSLFGHKVKVWYDGKDDNAKKTYALFDKAALAATIGCADNDIDNTAATKLGKAIKDAGFDVKNSTGYRPSLSFSRIGATYGKGDATADMTTNPTATTAQVWVVISNNDKKTIDVVIPVDTIAGQITKVDNWSTTKQVTLDSAFTAAGVFSAIDTATAYDQDDITSDPAGFVVGNKVIATVVTDRTTEDTVANDSPVFWLDTVPAKTVTGKVVAYDYALATNKATVTLDDGTVLKHTIIANDAISGKTGNYGVKTITEFDNLTYEFQLDMQGNWLDAKPVYDNTFIYGTYADYTTQLGSSSFTYRMIGVDLNGEVVQKDFTKYQNQGDATATSLTGGDTDGKLADMNMPYNDISQTGSGLVKRDVTDDTTAQVTFYKGFINNGNLMDNRAQTLYDIAGIQSLKGGETIYKNGASATTENQVYDFVGNTTAGSDTTIDRDDIKMGVALVDTENGAGTATHPYLYMNEETKFIVVDGYGTDSVKPVVYNGISELLGSAKSVTINTSSDVTTDATADGRAAEILFTCQDYQYSNTGVISKKANVMILPKEALEYDNGSNLYFFHGDGTNVRSNVKDAGGDAFRFTGYQGTEKVEVWIDDANVNTGANNELCKGDGMTALGANKFVLLVDTGDKAADGQPIYTTKALDTTVGKEQSAAPAANPKAICFDTATAYKADTMNSQTALLGADLVNVANAKVVNLDTANGTIESMADLNHASSVCTSITVCVEYAEAGSKVVSAIYVISITQ